ncbi:MAG: hypothetical protein AABW50_04745 [Nanoarchaeota archaeon]
MAEGKRYSKLAIWSFVSVWLVILIFLLGLIEQYSFYPFLLILFFIPVILSVFSIRFILKNKLKGMILAITSLIISVIIPFFVFVLAWAVGNAGG